MRISRVAGLAWNPLPMRLMVLVLEEYNWLGNMLERSA